ncbi:unnamed protein product, partial [Choristocarpus tenellus]
MRYLGIKVIRGWIGRCAAKERREGRVRDVQAAIEAAWYTGILGPMERSIARFDKERERDRAGMEAADQESKFYRYYCKLQVCILAIAHQKESIRQFSTMGGVTLRTSASIINPPCSQSRLPPKTITLWSRRAVRQLQRQLPPTKRLKDDALIFLTKGLPAGGRGGGGGSSGESGGGGVGQGLG